MDELLAVAAAEAPGLDYSEANPRVHAFNIVRLVFNDTDIATDTSVYCADGLRIAMRGFSATHWEVRNAASLAYGSLLARTLGFMNVRDDGVSGCNRRSTTGSDFFHRYPPLHAFLLAQLESAAHSLDGGGTEGALHPSLHPVLMLLSRFRPSLQCRNVDDPLSPSAFRAAVSRCATQRHHAVRTTHAHPHNLVHSSSDTHRCGVSRSLTPSIWPQVRALASRALAPLVPAEAARAAVCALLETLPVSAAAPPLPGGFNALHGLLLQVSNLPPHQTCCPRNPDGPLTISLGSTRRRRCYAAAWRT